MNTIDLKNLVGGALQEKFNASFEKVIKNLLDPNTPFKNKRSITIKPSFAQNEQRDNVKVDIDVSEKLSPSAPLETQFSMEQDLKDGKVYAREYGKDIPGQMTFKDYDNNQEEVDGKIVDTETGEIVEDKNIVDFRQAK